MNLPREKHTFVYKLHFPCSDNEAKYKSLLVGLKVAKRIGIKKLKNIGDFELVLR